MDFTQPFTVRLRSIKTKTNASGDYFGVVAKVIAPAEGFGQIVWFAAPLESHINVGVHEVELVARDQGKVSSDGGMRFLSGVHPSSPQAAHDIETQVQAPAHKPITKESNAKADNAIIKALKGIAETMEKDAPQIPNAQAIVELFDNASKGLKYPKIRFNVNHKRIRIYVAGERARFPGAIQITEDAPFGSRAYYGKIVDGVFHASKVHFPELVEFLTEFAADPAGVAGEYGRQNGNCCFCARDLTDDRSLTVGYGPVCADHYGLPWG